MKLNTIYYLAPEIWNLHNCDSHSLPKVNLNKEKQQNIFISTKIVILEKKKNFGNMLLDIV